MKKILIILLVALLSSLSSYSAEGWETNIEKAKNIAKTTNKSILIKFTGSDWCPPCIELEKTVFATSDFTKYAEDKLVLVELDYPQRKEQPAELKKQNQMLQQKYKIQGFPTVLITDSEGLPFAKTGFQPGGPEFYSEHLDQFLAKKVLIDSAYEEADKLTGDARAEKLVKALNQIPEDLLFHYQDVMEEIYELDPEDTTGFKKTQSLKAPLKELQGSVVGLAVQGKIDEALKSVDDFITSNSLEGENKQNALMVKLNCFNPQIKADLEQADKLMDEVIAISQTTRTGVEAQTIKGQIIEMKAQAK